MREILDLVRRAARRAPPNSTLPDADRAADVECGTLFPCGVARLSVRPLGGRGMLRYIELKTGYNDNGPAWIGRVKLSGSGKTIYFNGRPSSEDSCRTMNMRRPDARQQHIRLFHNLRSMAHKA